MQQGRRSLRCESHIRHHREKTALREEPVDRQHVEVRVEVEGFDEYVDGMTTPVVPSGIPSVLH